jgi:hypothetical protein
MLCSSSSLFNFTFQSPSYPSTHVLMFYIFIITTCYFPYFLSVSLLRQLSRFTSSSLSFFILSCFPPWSCFLFLLGLVIKFLYYFPSYLPNSLSGDPFLLLSSILPNCLSLLHISFLIEISPHLLKCFNSPRTEVSILMLSQDLRNQMKAISICVETVSI